MSDIAARLEARIAAYGDRIARHEDEIRRIEAELTDPTGCPDCRKKRLRNSLTRNQHAITRLSRQREIDRERLAALP